MSGNHPNHTSKATIRPALYIVATPIGNLSDISSRALDTLRSVAHIACEDTRVSKKLLGHFGISAPLISYHEHNAKQTRPKLLEMLTAGESIALISDAGTPLISDPGYKLVEEAAARGIPVVPIPGACSPVAALMGAGLPTNQFAFLGFLPTTEGQAVELLTPWKYSDATLITFTTASKCLKNLAVINEVFEDADIVLARELTKLYEEFIRGTIDDVIAELNGRSELRGEMVLLIKPKFSEDSSAADEKNKALLKDLLTHMPLKAAVDIVVKHTSEPKNKIYQMALEVKGE